jgi:hypothetical protein
LNTLNIQYSVVTMEETFGKCSGHIKDAGMYVKAEDQAL